MDRAYDYTVFPDNSREKFLDTCIAIKTLYPNSETKMLEDVDGSILCVFQINGYEVVVYDDYDVGAVYVKSDLDLTQISSSWKC
ncbi:MAG: hypothetical protein K6B14_05875 [Lachnospiraceae bacterium]|nr:hypothetical protein [Lachnospiraceae bacterium]